MTKGILAGLALLLTAGAGAAHAEGFYEPIPYYNNNVFLFCTIGVPQDCWIPISPALGTFTVTNQYCYNPVSSTTFARVCPHAFQSGTGSVSSSSSNLEGMLMAAGAAGQAEGRDIPSLAQENDKPASPLPE